MINANLEGRLRLRDLWRPNHLPRGRARLARALLLLAALGGCAKSNTASPSTGARVDGGPLALDTTDPKKLLAAVDALSGPLKDSQKPYEVLSALGNLYYDNGRYLDAVDSLRQALEKAAPVEAAADALRARGVKPAAALPAECKKAPPAVGLEQVAAAAKKLEATEPAKALACDEQLQGDINDLRARHADALYLIGQPETALEEHKQVLARAPDSPESLFFVGAITLELSQGDKSKLEEGKRYWRRLLQVAPNHPRAALVKESLPNADTLFTPRQPDTGTAPPVAEQPLPPGHPAIDGQAGSPAAPRAAASAPAATPPPAGSGPTPEQLQAIAEAASQTERTPELEQGLDSLTAQADQDLDSGNYQEARAKMVRVMPMRPDDPRTAAVLGAAMAGLGKPEMAERVLSRALQEDPRQPRALYEMGKLLAARGDKAGAKEKFTALQSADAKFAQAHHVAAELARLK